MMEWETISARRTTHRASTSTRWHFAFGAMLSQQRNPRPPIVNPPNSTHYSTSVHLLPFPKFHPGPCSNVGMRRGTDTHTQTAVTSIHFASATPHAKCKQYVGYMQYRYVIVLADNVSIRDNTQAETTTKKSHWTLSNENSIYTLSSDIERQTPSASLYCFCDSDAVVIWNCRIQTHVAKIITKRHVADTHITLHVTVKMLHRNYTVSQKKEDTKLMVVTLSILNQFLNLFHL